MREKIDSTRIITWNMYSTVLVTTYDRSLDVDWLMMIDSFYSNVANQSMCDVLGFVEELLFFVLEDTFNAQ